MGLLTPLAVRVGSISWLPRVLPQITATDTLLQRLSSGRVTLLDVAGLPNLVLTVPGRRSGASRSTPLLCVPQDDRFLVAGSNFGRDREPRWVGNLTAAGGGSVRYRGRSTEITSRELSDAERESAWRRLVEVWPAFALYEQRTARQISVFELSPADRSSEDTASSDPTEWLLTEAERANPRTRLDAGHPGRAWSEGNLVRPLIHGATYFAELHERLEATREGDLVLFTDWQGDSDERLTGEPGSEVADVLARADERGVDVRGLIWRSHWDKLGFTAGENRTLGEELQERGAEALLDMRVRTGGSHHQKMLVIRHKDDATRDIAYVGGIDLCHSRRDDADHLGDAQALTMAEEYGDTPPWHDIQAAISGPAVHDVETVFRERWEDPTPLSRNPISWAQDHLRGLDLSPDPLPDQAPPPPAVDGGTHIVQLLRTYPNLRHGRDYEFARGGERSVARGYSKALGRARRMVYVEDQYLWGHHVGNVFEDALRAQPDLRVIAVVPLHPDLGGLSRFPQLLGRRRAMQAMIDAAPDRVAVYGIENAQGTPIYVHAKTCIVDDTWSTIGSDNFNRRSWTHDSELSAVVLDRSGERHSAYARRLRLTLAAEHLGREVDDSSLLEVMADCVEPAGMFDAYERAAQRLDEWHAGGQAGDRPVGRLRRMQPPELGVVTRTLAYAPYLVLHDPDGRPRPLRRQGGF